jgi:hypothetical protein
VHDADRDCRSDSGDGSSDGTREQKAKNLTNVAEPECATEPALEEPDRAEGMSRVDEAERDSEPAMPANGQIGGCGGKHDPCCHRNARIGTQHEQDPYRDARGGPKRWHPWVRAKG